MAIRPNPSAAPLTMLASWASPELQWSSESGPMLDGVHTSHAHSPTSGPPGQETPSEVRVD
eukprot:4336081-Alexandrium_andersonii.AAC.1